MKSAPSMRRRAVVVAACRYARGASRNDTGGCLIPMAMRYGTSKEWLRTLAVAGLGCVLLVGVWLLHASHAPLPQRHYVAISRRLLLICGAGAAPLLWHG